MAKNMKFTFENATGRYRSGNGQFASRNTVRGALDKYLEVKTREATALAIQLRNREITIAQWQAAMREVIAESHLNGAMLAKGGKSRMTQADYGRVGALVKFEYRQLEKLAVQVGAGLPLDGHFMQRVGQYVNAGRHVYHVVDRLEQRGRGFEFERSIRHASDSCNGCLSAAAAGLVPIGTLPLPGERDCCRNCRCQMQYEKART